MEITVNSKTFKAKVTYNIEFTQVSRGGHEKTLAICKEKSRVWEIGRDETDALKKITHTLENIHE